MPSYRTYYPVQYLAIGPYASGSGLPVHGLQSIGMTTTFNLEQVFEQGQIEVYENIEGLPAVELTATKVLDGYPLIYHLATRDATSRALNNRTNSRADVFLSVFSDAQDSSSGVPLVQAYCSGMYVSALTYNFPVEGNANESVTLVGEDRIWKTSGFAFNGHFDNTDAPLFGVQRRQHVLMGNAAASGSVWPKFIPGMTVVNGSGYNIETASQFGAHIQDVSITTNLGREDLFELGRKRSYYRYASFPTPVDCTINLTAGGAIPYDGVNADSTTDNLTNEPIVIRLADGSIFDLGTKNKLQNVSWSGGDAGTGGGVVTITYAFQNQNKLDVYHPIDPAGIP